MPRESGIAKGKLIVLVDSDSASASEVFARAVQLKKRGKVLGDQTAGAVMLGRSRSLQLGGDRAIYYGASISEAPVIMSDGKSLEGIGVIPDETVIPSGEDLAADPDPVLARAASLLGVPMTPEQAGALFPTEWD